MKNPLSHKLLISAFIISIVFQLGCKISNPTPNNTQQQVDLITNKTGRILYLNGSELWSANYDGTGKKKVNIPQTNNLIIVSDKGDLPKISANGNTIFFDAIPNTTTNAYKNIYSCNFDGSNLKQLTNKTVNDGFDYGISDTYIEGGKLSILFIKYDNYNVAFPQFYSADSTGANAKSMFFYRLRSQYFNYNASPKVSTDGFIIYFSCTAFTIQGTPIQAIYALNKKDSTSQPIVSIVQQTPGLIPLIGKAYGNQQQKILYTNAGSEYTVNSEIWTSNADGTNAQKINITLPTYLSISNMNTAVISPDGKTIFFSAAYPFGFLNIYSCNLDGSNLKTVIINSGFNVKICDIN